MNDDAIYLSDVMKSKGYGGCNIKLETIGGRPWAIMYMIRQDLVELFAQKVNMELGLPLAMVKTSFTMGVKGLNVTRIFHQLLDCIEDISCADEPVNEDRLFSLTKVFYYCLENYRSTIEQCIELNLENSYEVVVYCNAIHNIGLYETPDGRFYVPEEVEA